MKDYPKDYDENTENEDIDNHEETEGINVAYDNYFYDLDCAVLEFNPADNFAELKDSIAKNDSNTKNEFGELKKFSQYTAVKLDQLNATSKKLLRWNKVLTVLLILLVAGFFIGLFGLASALLRSTSSSDNYFSPDPGKGLTFSDAFKDNNLPPKRNMVPNSMPVIGSDISLTFTTDSPIADIAEFVSPSTVAVYAYVKSEDEDADEDELIFISEGSGIVLSKDGYILTNQHVIDYDEFKVVFIDDDEYEWDAEVIGYDVVSDLAVIKVERKDCIPAYFGDSDKLRAGETAISLGNSLGDGSGTVTSGIISGIDRDIYQSNGHVQAFIQTDAPINPGNSGGPLVNSKGEVIGVNSLKSIIAAIEEDGFIISSEGVSYAIPLNHALEICKILIKNGRIERPSFGIRYYILDAEEIKEYDKDFNFSNIHLSSILSDNIPPQQHFAYIISVSENGPADTAGISPGDVLLSVSGEIIDSDEAMQDALDNHVNGDTISAELWSAEKKYNYTTKVTLHDMANINYAKARTIYDHEDD